MHGRIGSKVSITKLTRRYKTNNCIEVLLRLSYIVYVPLDLYQRIRYFKILKKLPSLSEYLELELQFYTRSVHEVALSIRNRIRTISELYGDDIVFPDDLIEHLVDCNVTISPIPVRWRYSDGIWRSGDRKVDRWGDIRIVTSEIKELLGVGLMACVIEEEIREQLHNSLNNLLGYLDSKPIGKRRR